MVGHAFYPSTEEAETRSGVGRRPSYRAWEDVGEDLAGVSSLVPSCGSQRSNSDSLPAEVRTSTLTS